jgi:hypothetical protein
MKKYLLPLIVFVLLTGTSCQEKIDIEKEKQAIITVIEEETDAFIHRDYERWVNTYVQDESNIRLSASSNDYNYVIGWDDLNSSFKEAFEDTTDLQVKAVKTNYKIKVYDNAAWIVCDEKYLNIETGEDMGIALIEARILEKVEEEWKIVYLSYVDATSYEEDKEVEGEPETEDTE